MQKAKAFPSLKEERRLWQQGFDFVVGLDEVGRGPLAGPVCAAAVVICHPGLDPGSRPWIPAFARLVSDLSERAGMTKRGYQLRDSKKLSASQREMWYEFLTTHPGIKWGIGLVTERTIDRVNILEATKLAMRLALEELVKKGVEADYLLLDGNFILQGLSLSQKAIVRGDEKIWSCAAASVIAKVTRDRLMAKYHKKYPQYGFDKHKGYGTRYHIGALEKYGPCAIHRRSFKPCQLD